MTSTSSSTQHTSVPAQRDESAVPTRHLQAVQRATDVLYELVGELGETAVRGPSLLPGWSRAHVVTHLARNADALVNLLTWARTGVEHQAYASRIDRDADIEEGARRLLQLLRADLDSACQRFTEATLRMPSSAWKAEITAPKGQQMPAHQVPWLRLRELWIHMVDLDCGITFEDLPADFAEEFLDDAVRQFDGRQGVPPVRMEVELPDGRQRIWELNGPGGSAVSGSAGAVLGWLTGRENRLTGDVPELPAWV